MSIVNYESKYLKYKTKYEELKKLIGGNDENIASLEKEYVQRKEEIDKLQSELNKEEANLSALKKLHTNWESQRKHFENSDVIPQLKGKQGLFSKDVDEKYLSPNATQNIQDIKEYFEQTSQKLNEETRAQQENIDLLEQKIRDYKNRIKEAELKNQQNKKNTDKLKKDALKAKSNRNKL
jgi:hypothetical protein